LIREQTIPRYQAEAQVVLHIRSTRVVKFDAVLSDLPPGPEVLRTEMDVINSRAMAERVVNSLSAATMEQLARIQEIRPPLTRLFRRVGKRLSGDLASLMATDVASTASPDRFAAAENEESAASLARLPSTNELADIVMGGLRVSNDGQSYTIRIGFSSADPELAALLANEYAEAYIANQLDLKTQATEQASAWLSQRLVELRRELEASEAIAQAYRRTAGILEDKGSTVTAQQLGEINTQLVQARKDRLEAESRLSTARSLLEGDGDIKAIPDIMSSQLVQELRAKQAELTRKLAEINSRYTEAYPNKRDLETELATLQEQIGNEVNRVVQNLNNQVETARNKERALEGELARLEEKFGEGSDAEVKLGQMEREADANRAVYEAYLSRFKETSEQQKLQEPDSYLISSAMPPSAPSYPRSMPLLALGAMFGGFAGIVLAFCRELFDQRLHSISQVEEVTGLPVLGLLPSLPHPRLARPEDYILRRPESQFNEALRTTRAAIALSQEEGLGKVILVTSAIPGEGKTAFCLSLARSLAADDHKVLLIDADLRRPGIARALGAASSGHLSELLAGEIDLREAIHVDGKSGAHYIAAREGRFNPQDLLGSDRMQLLIAEARAAYEIIIVDSPPILVGADAAIVAKFVDHCLFFIRWGGTARDYVVNALRRLELYKVTVNGIVLSHVNVRRHARYAAGEGYYHSYGVRRGLLMLAKPRGGDSADQIRSSRQAVPWVQALGGKQAVPRTANEVGFGSAVSNHLSAGARRRSRMEVGKLNRAQERSPASVQDYPYIPVPIFVERGMSFPIKLGTLSEGLGSLPDAAPARADLVHRIRASASLTSILSTRRFR
jgi:capsular exopolysaccharide synthesis family protein